MSVVVFIVALMSCPSKTVSLPKPTEVPTGLNDTELLCDKADMIGRLDWMAECIDNSTAQMLQQMASDQNTEEEKRNTFCAYPWNVVRWTSHYFLDLNWSVILPFLAVFLLS